MKKLLLSLTLLLSIPAAHAMGPAAYESGAAACESGTAESSAVATYKSDTAGSSAATAYEPESSAVAVEMIPVQQAIDSFNIGLTNPQITELTRQLQCCTDENGLIATTTTHVILKHFLNESVAAILSLDDDSSPTDLVSSSVASLNTMPTETTPTEKSDELLIKKMLYKQYHNELLEALHYNNLDEAKALLKSIPQQVINRAFLVSAGDHPDMVQLLLQHGANPNTTDESGYNVLQTLMKDNSNASSIPHLNTTIRILVLAGLQVDHKNNNGHTILDMAADYGTEYALRNEANNYTPYRSIPNYHHIRSLILNALREAQAIREHTGAALRDAQLPEVLTNLIYEYATLPDRNKEIDFVNQHWQQIKWKSRRDNFRHSMSLIHIEMLNADTRSALIATTFTFALTATATLIFKKLCNHH